MIRTKLVVLAASAMLFLGACATTDPNRKAKAGAGIGAVTGAVIGKQIAGDKGAAIGAILGGGTGALIGANLDKQEADLQARLAREAAAEQVEISRIDEQTILINLAEKGVEFDTKSSTIKPSSRIALDKIVASLTNFPQTNIRIVGHTDSTGTEAFNKKLSEERAASVADYLLVRGIEAKRVTTFGAGELQPLTTNVTVEGRAQNRRVEMFISNP